MNKFFGKRVSMKRVSSFFKKILVTGVISVAVTSSSVVGLQIGFAGAQTASAATACITGNNLAWQSNSIAPQSGKFTATFDATPNANLMDGVFGFSNLPSAGYTDFAAIVRFNNLGKIDARNGSAYTAAAAIPYSAGSVYHFRFVIDVTNHKYD